MGVSIVVGRNYGSSFRRKKRPDAYPNFVSRIRTFTTGGWNRIGVDSSSSDCNIGSYRPTPRPRRSSISIPGLRVSSSWDVGDYSEVDHVERPSTFEPTRMSKRVLQEIKAGLQCRKLATFGRELLIQFYQFRYDGGPISKTLCSLGCFPWF